MPWGIYLICSITLFSTVTLLQRVTLKESSSRPIAFSIGIWLTTGIILAFLGTLFGQMFLPHERLPVINLVAMPFIYAGAMILSYQALKLVEASKFTLIFASRTIVSILIATIFLNEGLRPFQLIGVAFVLAGVLLVTLQREDKKSRKGELMALGAAFFFAVSTINDKFLLQSAPMFSYVSLTFIAPALLTALIYPKEAKHVPSFFTKKKISRVLLIGVLLSCGSLAFNQALRIAPNVSEVISANSSNVIVTVLLSVIFLNERSHLVKKIIAAVLTFIGLMIVS